MNECIFVGRMASDAAVNTTQNGKSVATVSLAVDRRGSNGGVDFLRLVFWDKAADIIGQYGAKGKQLAVKAHATVRSYEKDGKKMSTTEFVVDQFEFLGSKKAENNNADTEEVPF